MRKKIVPLLMAMSLLALHSLHFADAATMKIYPTDDVFVRMKTTNTNVANTNFQDSWPSDLRAGYEQSWGVDRSFLKFNLSSVPGEITSANLSLLPISGPSTDMVVQFYSVESNDWNEDTLTWNTAPSMGTLITTKTFLVSPPSGRFSIDVSNYVDSELVTFGLKSSDEVTTGRLIPFYSKDYYYSGFETDSVNWPYLLVEYSGESCQTVADTNCNNCVDLTEYNIFKYNYKNGLLSSVSLTDYNTIKYNFKNGLISC